MCRRLYVKENKKKNDEIELICMTPPPPTFFSLNLVLHLHICLLHDGLEVKPVEEVKEKLEHGEGPAQVGELNQRREEELVEPRQD